MKMSVTSAGVTISSTGDKSYGSAAAVASEKFTNLTGKVMEMSKTVDGLVVTNKSLDGKVSGLQLSVDAYKTYVEETFVSGKTFGAYKSAVEQTSRGVTQRFESVEEDMREVSAHVNSGLLDEDEAGNPVYGIEVGQRTKVDGKEVFNKYARFTSDKLSFYDSNGVEVAYVSDNTLFITHSKVTESAMLGGFADTVLKDGSVVTKWLGGS
jgi:hypothetical protein